MSLITNGLSPFYDIGIMSQNGHPFIFKEGKCVGISYFCIYTDFWASGWKNKVAIQTVWYLGFYNLIIHIVKGHYELLTLLPCMPFCFFPPRYNCNIVESGVKHQQPKPFCLKV